MKISAALLASLIDFAAHRGMNPLALQKMVVKNSLNSSTLDTEDYLVVLNAIVHHLEDPNIGVAFGNYLNLTALGMVYTISLQTQSVEQAILILESYLNCQFPLLKIVL